jgi:hypothetical protein
LDPLHGHGWSFSKRIDRYLTVATYGIEGSYIGYEYALARFCVDTVLEVIDILHCVLFPNDYGALWLRIPRNQNGCLDLAALATKERMLQI